jgi:hypothetical protein
MSDNEKLLRHARNLVGLLEKPEPGLATWGMAIESALDGITAESGLHVAPELDQPACPHCGAQPLRFNMQQGPVPTGQPDGSQLLIAQFWCSLCKRQFAMQIMGVIPGEQQPDPASDFAAQRKRKLWSPS